MEDGAHIRLKLDTANPIALSDFVSMFVGIGNQFEKFVSAEYPGLKTDSEFFIKEVREGSIEADLVAWVVRGGLIALDTIEKVEVFARFIGFVKKRISQYFHVGGRANKVSTGDLSDFLRTTAAIAHDENGTALLEAAVFEDGERKVRAGFKFNTQQAREAERQIGEHRQELEEQTAAEHPRVMMRFVRPSIEKVSSHRRTGERALVEAVHPKPLAVLYASDLARERIQHELKEAEGNPFNLLFDVDVNVEVSRGKPVAYRIVAVHDVTDAPEEEG
jgi:hypothetical protein